MNRQSMRVVVAPDKFKGSLTAVEAAEAIGEGLRQGRPGVDVVLAPVADDGDGTVDAAVAAGYDRGVSRVVLGVGGSATTDGGTGMARALGVRFLDADGRDLPPGAPPCAGYRRST